MIKLQFLTSEGCVHCAEAKRILEEIKPDFPDLEVTEVDMVTPEGQEMIGKYMIMSSPGIVINGELFSTGAVNRDEMVAKLKSLKQ